MSELIAKPISKDILDIKVERKESEEVKSFKIYIQAVNAKRLQLKKDLAALENEARDMFHNKVPTVQAEKLYFYKQYSFLDLTRGNETFKSSHHNTNYKKKPKDVSIMVNNDKKGGRKPLSLQESAL